MTNYVELIDKKEIIDLVNSEFGLDIEENSEKAYKIWDRVIEEYILSFTDFMNRDLPNLTKVSRHQVNYNPDDFLEEVKSGDSESLIFNSTYFFTHISKSIYPKKIEREALLDSVLFVLDKSVYNFLENFKL